VTGGSGGSAIPNLIVILGPTASGKTRLAVAAAEHLGGEIISADSRQVFRTMDIGTGKDLDEYGHVPYHLIDILEPGEEFSVFAFLRRFSDAFTDIATRGKLPLLVGGTGLYLDAVLRGYRMVHVPEDPILRRELSPLSRDELQARLLSLNPQVHNTTDLLDRERLVRAIEIALLERAGEGETVQLPPLRPLVFGMKLEREVLRRRITERLKVRLQGGMIEEVQGLLDRGVPPERLDYYGLEYRFICRFLLGELNRNDMVQKLNAAIHDFAKKQENWFRRMEKQGVEIIWLDAAADPLPQFLAEAKRRGY
jgi:tRNA dimethylallyltransferase